MPKCQRCHRELKNHTESGMGEVCRMKANRLSDSADSKIKVVPLFLSQLPRRRYLVFTSPRATVLVKELGNARYAECQLCGNHRRCDHVDLVAEADNTRFPQTAQV
ncbi:MAG TPA: hypothetical protein PKY82_23870 [Pyrinomonadaceae bacterium]|nr:hypothetical protein [Pyrinomonadaceae bacterium]